jgi:hypothetical protein
MPKQFLDNLDVSAASVQERRAVVPPMPHSA